MNPVSIVPVNDLSRWSPVDLSEIAKRVDQVLRSGMYLNGPQVKELEARFGESLGRRYVLAVASGTDALVIALAALRIGAEQVVATVANAAGYATNAILRQMATPLLVDVDPESGQMSPELLTKAFREHKQIRAVIVTHLYGLMADISRIAQICRANGALLIEDCAQSFGASSNGVPAGAWGDAAAFSLYPTKNLAALGDGGMVAFQDSEAFTRARKIAQYGWSSRYDVELEGGINSRLDEMQAAVVLQRYGSLDSRNSRRLDILRRYAKSVSAPRRFIFEDSERCVAHLAVMQTPTRDRDRAAMNDSGIDSAIHYPIPDHKQPAWRQYFKGVVLPNAEAHCAKVLTLPCFPELTEEEIVRVCKALQSL